MSWQEIGAKAVRLTLVLNIANVAFSLAVSKFYLNSLDQDVITGVFGNLSLLLAMLMFLYGSATQLGGTASWKSAMKLLGIGGREWKEGDSSKAERKAIVFLFTGVIMLAETVFLAIFTV